MAANIPLPPEPRYHATPQAASHALHPGTVTARLVVMPPELWKEVEAYLRNKGFKPY